MSLNFIQFHAGVVVPALQSLEPTIKYEMASDVLVTETIWHESARLTALGQWPREGVTEARPFGPGLGVAMVEEATWYWMVTKDRIRNILGLRTYGELAWDLRLCVVACRLRYALDPSPLPPGDLNDEDALKARAAYWGRVYQGTSNFTKMAKYVTDAKAIWWEGR